MAEYRLTPAARNDLAAIWRYTLATWGDDQADRYVDRMTETFQALAEQPGIGQTCEHIRPGYRGWPVERHIVYFRIEDRRRVIVVRILHARMDARRHF